MSKKYNILFIGDIRSEKIRLWAKFIRDSGYELEFLSTSKGELSDINVQHFVNTDTYEGTSSGLFGNVRKFWTGWDVIHKQKYDLVHVHSPFNRSLCWHAAKHPTCIASIWEDIDLLPVPNQDESTISGWLSGFLSNVSLITFAHRGLENQVLKVIPQFKRKEILPTGIDVERFGELPRIGAEPGFVRFCYVGALMESNGTDLAIKAFDKIADSRPNTLLTIVGTGDENYTNYLKKLVRQVGLYQRVHFTGRVTDSEFDAILKRSDIFLFPFRKNGFGLKLLSAMAAGLPVITSQEEGVSDLVIDNVTGLTVPKDDEVALANAMSRIAPDESMIQRLGKNARDLAIKVYSFDLHAERMLSLYEELIKNANPLKLPAMGTEKKSNVKR